MNKVKEWVSGEEFVFDGVKKVPVIGALYAVPRTVTYGLMGNKSQSASFAKGFVDNLRDTTGLGAKLLIAPVAIAANMGGSLIGKCVNKGSGHGSGSGAMEGKK